MDLAFVVLVVAAVGGNYGWQPANEEDAPRRHTVRFQTSGDDAWGGDRYQASNPSATSDSRRYDQRGATIGGDVDPIRTAQAPPWPLDRAQQAAVETGNVMRDAVEAGIQQANQDFSRGSQQFVDGAKSAGREFGEQLQNLTGIGGQTSPPPPYSTSQSSPSNWPAPPLASSLQSSPSASQISRAHTATTWTSIRPELAPPRLLTPPLANTNRIASNPALGRDRGPVFPEASDSRAPNRSVLTDPAVTNGQGVQPDWSSVWGSASTPGQATIGRTASDSASNNNDDSVGLVPVPPRVRTSTQTQTADAPDATRWTWPEPSAKSTVGEQAANPNSTTPSVGDRYSQSPAATPAAPAPATNTAADLWANVGTPSAGPSNNAPPEPYPTPPPATVTSNPLTQPEPQQGNANQAMISVAPPANHPGQPPAAVEEVPWRPLLAVSLALAGSLGANLFLGWSYADARHRYRALVAKTTHSFQQAAGLAA